MKIWWNNEEGSLEKDLKSINNDKDASTLAWYVVNNNTGVEIYTEAKNTTGELTYMERLIEIQKRHVSGEGDSDDEYEASEYFVDGIHFEDNEEERMHDSDG